MEALGVDESGGYIGCISDDEDDDEIERGGEPVDVEEERTDETDVVGQEENSLGVRNPDSSIQPT